MPSRAHLSHFFGTGRGRRREQHDTMLCFTLLLPGGGGGEMGLMITRLDEGWGGLSAHLASCAVAVRCTSLVDETAERMRIV